MPYTLWGEPDSGSFMIEAALAEAGADVELVDIDLARGEQHKASFLAINPVGKIPALRFPDGELMTQSAAILLVVAEAYPDAGLMPPQGHPERRQSLRWLVHLAAEIYPLIELADYPLRFAPPETSEIGVRSLIRKRLRERWQVVERGILGEGSFLASGFSALDLAVAVISGWSVGTEWRACHCPHIDAIARSVSVRPRVAPVWARHFGGDTAHRAQGSGKQDPGRHPPLGKA